MSPDATLGLETYFPSRMAADHASQYPYAWDLSMVVAENLKHWSSHNLRLDRQWLGFGGDGFGNGFCLALDRDADNPVFHWGWICAEATEVADGLASFWPGWLSGRIKSERLIFGSSRQYGG